MSHGSDLAGRSTKIKPGTDRSGYELWLGPEATAQKLELANTPTRKQAHRRAKSEAG